MTAIIEGKQRAIARSFFPVALLEQVEAELRSKAHLWKSGVATPTFSDRLAYFVLKDSGFFMPALEDEKDDT